MRARYLGVIELTWASSLLIGAPAAGWLIARFGMGCAVLGDSRSLSPCPPGHAVGHRAGFRIDRRHPIQLALDRSAVALLVTVGLYSGASEIMFVVFGAWLEDGFGLSLLALGGRRGAGGRLGIGRRRIDPVLWTDRIGKRRSVGHRSGDLRGRPTCSFVTNANLTAGLASMALALGGFEFTIVSTFPLASEMRPLARTRFLALLWPSAWGWGGRSVHRLGPFLYEQSGLTANTLVAAAANLVALVLLLGWVRESESGK